MKPEAELDKLQLQLLNQENIALKFLEDMADNFGNDKKCMGIFSEFEPTLNKIIKNQARIKELKSDLI